MQTKKSIESY